MLRIRIDLLNSADLTIVKAPVLALVIFDKHNLGTGFQYQLFIDRVGILRKLACDLCSEHNG
ncbi:hypothetical protein D9M68_757540 [compost metagenome]